VTDNQLTDLTPLRFEHLMRPVLRQLVDLLEGLSADDWNLPTRAGQWRVRDVAAHLLDGDVRRLSMQRDGHPGPVPDQAIDSHQTLVDYLNALNASWLKAFERVSPQVILEVQKLVGPPVCDLFENLNPEDEALFGVAWAGEERSTNAFDIAREYTEKWHHQQQIREAVGAPLLDSPKWIEPALETFVRGLPYAYRQVEVKTGVAVVLESTGSVTAAWTLQRRAQGWTLHLNAIENPTTHIRMSSEVAWRLFSKMMDPDDAPSQIAIEGDAALADPLLEFVGFMV